MAPEQIALRRGRHSQTGQVYLVTFATARRTPHFVDWDVAADAARLMTRPEIWTTSRLLAWVLMPDHWHGLVELGEGEGLSELVGRLKGRSARFLRHQHPAIGPVWARCFHDRALRVEEALVDAARYLVLNPVRAGLVGRVADWPFWDAVWIETTTSRG